MSKRTRLKNKLTSATTIAEVDAAEAELHEMATQKYGPNHRWHLDIQDAAEWMRASLKRRASCAL